MKCMKEIYQAQKASMTPHFNPELQIFSFIGIMFPIYIVFAYWNLLTGYFKEQKKSLQQITF